MVAKSGRGVRVTDVDGNEFLDLPRGIAVTSTGHCHPEIVKAIQDQAAELIHMSGTDFYYEAHDQACGATVWCRAYAWAAQVFTMAIPAPRQWSAR